MRHIRYSALIVVLFLFAGLSYGQATRTWVSGVGDDVNPCSRTAPCKTFAGAISKTATNGEISCLDPAGYGSVTITKSITIDCEDTQGSILAAGTNGVIINITAATDTKKAVKLRGISINGAATGINGMRVLAANTVNIEQVVIDGFTQHGVSIENTAIPAKVFIDRCSIRSNMGNGISGFSVGTTSDIIVSNSLLSGNGIAAINASNGATFRLSGNTIAFNTTGLSAASGKILSFRNNAIDGNGTNGTPTSAVPLQ